MPTEPTYRIKPLVWRPGALSGTFFADTMFGRLWLRERADGTVGVFLPDRDLDADSLEAAKSAAEAHYRERIGQALEVVE